MSITVPYPGQEYPEYANSDSESGPAQGPKYPGQEYPSNADSEPGPAQPPIVG